MGASLSQLASQESIREMSVSCVDKADGGHLTSLPADAEPIRREAFDRMDAGFPTNRGLSPIFLLLANAHRYAIDYIEQAPVIVAVVTRGTTHVSPSEHAFFEEQFARLCEEGARLRDVMAAFGLPLPLRKLDARVLTASRSTVIRRLALMNPSTLAQIIPDTRKKQNAWLEGLDQWCRGMAQRTEGQIDRCPFFEWAAANLGGITFRQASSVSHLVDYVQAHQATFNVAWTLERARRAEQEWHEELALEDLDRQPGTKAMASIDYGALPRRWENDGFCFVALQTGDALRREGAAMHHCVSSYWHSVVIGRSRIYSVLEKGRRVATLEFYSGADNYRWGKGSYRIRQLVGVRNSRPAPEIFKAATAFAKEINGKDKN
jgi:PcfJ-like protein